MSIFADPIVPGLQIDFRKIGIYRNWGQSNPTPENTLLGLRGNKIYSFKRG